MKRRMLLGISILVLANMAVASPSQRIGREVRNVLTDTKLSVLRGKFYDEVRVPEKLTSPNIESIKEKFEEITDDLYNNYKSFPIDSPDETNKTAFETKLDELVQKVNTEISNKTTTPEDKSKLEAFKINLDKFVVYKKALDNYRKEMKELESNKVENDSALNRKYIEMINPNSYVSEFIIERPEDKRTELYTNKNDFIEKVLNSTDTGGLLKSYNDAKTALSTAEKEYSAAKTAFEKAEKTEKEAKETELKTAKTGLDAALVNFNNAKRDINSVLSIAGTNVDAYTMLNTKIEKAEKEKAELIKAQGKKEVIDAKTKEIDKLKEAKEEEEIRILDKLYEWKEERDAYAALADTYVSGRTNVRILENAINIEENRKAIEKNREDIQKLRKDFNSGMAQNAALAAVDFGTVRTKTIKVGAGLGYHRGASAVAIGVAAAPSEKLMLNVKWSTGRKIQHSTIGVGGVYEIELK